VQGLIASKSSKRTANLDREAQGSERSAAFDLIDALTRSGALAIHDTELHVVIASTHCFKRSLMQTLVHDSINPIEKVERSSLIVSSTVHRRSIEELVDSSHHARIVEQLQAELAQRCARLAAEAAAGEEAEIVPAGEGASVEELLAALTTACGGN
jgi:hypothetical protein